MAATKTDAREPHYDVTVWQLPNGKWRWQITARDFDKHPIYGEYEWPLPYIQGERKTAEKAIQHAAAELSAIVAGDIRRTLRQTFVDSSPVATASV